MPDELKPCPILSCESTDVEIEQWRVAIDEDNCMSVCNICGFEGPTAYSPDGAFNAWNNLERREDGRRKALEEACKAVCNWCRDDVPLEWDDPTQHYFHYNPRNNQIIFGCNANPIRRLMAEAGTVESEKQ